MPTTEAPGHDGLPDEDEQVKTTRSAVDVLQADQRRLLFDGNADRDPPLEAWIDGFSDAQAVVNWWQAAAVRTFGRVAEFLPPEQIYTDHTLAEYLLDHDGDGETYRRRILRRWLRPCCTAAWRQLDGQATERIAHAESDDVDGERGVWTDIEPGKERHIGMRPAFSLLDQNQQIILRRLWGGFESPDAVDRWLHDLPPATGGTHDTTLAARLCDPPDEGRWLLGDSRKARRWRLRFAIVDLLPAFADAAASLQGEEVTQTDSTLEWRQG
jgi:hypothetical protein